jgi:pimeloyl-ACP methyl ester carboxylesterase
MPVRSPQWTSNADHTAYLFYQGILDSQTQASRYIGPHPLHTSTHETTHSVHPGITAFPRERLWVYPELDDIDRKPKWGIISDLMQRQRGIRLTHPSKHLQEYQTLYPQDQPGSVHRYGLKINQTSFGQARDILNHKKRYDALMDPLTRKGETPQHIVLYGTSRGAATTYAALATYKESYQHVKLCVLEAPPATMSAPLKAYFGRHFGKLLYRKSLASLFFGNSHQTLKEKQAIAYVDQFPAHIPLLIITSTNDAVVPHKSSLNLALRTAEKRIRRMKKNPESAHEIAPVYLLQLDKSGHHVAIGDKQTRLRYQAALHAIYKKHGLPYIPEYALAGITELNSAELTRGTLKTQVEYQHQFKRAPNKACREAIRKTALLDLTRASAHAQHATENQRIMRICQKMPLYAKYPSLFFRKTNAQHTLDQLAKSDSSAHPSILWKEKQSKPLFLAAAMVTAATLLTVSALFYHPLILLGLMITILGYTLAALTPHGPSSHLTPKIIGSLMEP